MITKIYFFVMDVDGTLTDGKLYISSSGELFKAFNVKDGYGIHHLLPEMGIKPVIITGRESSILVERCRELGIKMLFQGVTDKLMKLRQILAEQSSEDNIPYSLENVAFIGDDLPDLSCIKEIKFAGGLTGCPADSSDELLAQCDFISAHNGGEGAVRSFINWIRSRS